MAGKEGLKKNDKIEDAKVIQGGEKTPTTAAPERKITLSHINKEQALELNSMLRTAGVQVDLTITAVVYELVVAYVINGGDITLKGINNVVAQVTQNPDFAPKEAQK
jgi:hypothetical protein